MISSNKITARSSSTTASSEKVHPSSSSTNSEVNPSYLLDARRVPLQFHLLAESQAALGHHSDPNPVLSLKASGSFPPQSGNNLKNLKVSTKLNRLRSLEANLRPQFAQCRKTLHPDQRLFQLLEARPDLCLLLNRLYPNRLIPLVLLNLRRLSVLLSLVLPSLPKSLNPRYLKAVLVPLQLLGPLRHLLVQPSKARTEFPHRLDSLHLHIIHTGALPHLHSANRHLRSRPHQLISLLSEVATTLQVLHLKLRDSHRLYLVSALLPLKRVLLQPARSPQLR